MSNTARRTGTNVLSSTFHVTFRERLIFGASRWFDDENKKKFLRAYVDYVDDTSGYQAAIDILGRTVNSYNALNGFFKPKLFNAGGEYLDTCVSEYCDHRRQVMLSDSQIRQLEPTVANQQTEIVIQRARSMLQGNKSTVKCPSCGQETMFFATAPVTHKWIYIMKDAYDGVRKHYCEISVGAKPNKGKIYRKMSGGQYLDSPFKPFQGRVHLFPKPADFEWRFFMSPVRLGKKALEMLLEPEASGSISGLIEAERAVKHAKLGDADAGLIYGNELQPWRTVHTLNFSEDRVKKPKGEVVPLVDPFSWATQLADFDYLPTLNASMTLEFDEDEQSKLFIASILHQASKKRRMRKPGYHPRYDKYVEDEMNIVGEMRRWDGKKKNQAKEWVDCYRETLEYVNKEANNAAMRLVLMLRYNMGHRIVETACQESGQKSGGLAIGMFHWAHVLVILSKTEEGRRFLIWLTGQGKVSDKIKPYDRIPIRNVLNGEEIKKNTAVAKEAGNSVTANIFAVLCKFLDARSETQEDLANIYVNGLENINIESQTVQGKDVVAVSKVTLDVGEYALKRYINSLPVNEVFEAEFKNVKIEGFKGRVTALSSLKDVLGMVSLCIDISEFSKKTRKYATETERLENLRKKVETPLYSYIYLRGISEKYFGTILHTKGAQKGGGVGTALIMVSGTLDAAMSGVKSLEAIGANDPVAAIGWGCSALNSLMLLQFCLFFGVASPMLLVPIVLGVAGGLFIKLFKKNDLQQFTQHCFLGQSYGCASWAESGKSWLQGKPYNSLRYKFFGENIDPDDPNADYKKRLKLISQLGSTNIESPERFTNQRIALMRLLSNFSTCTVGLSNPISPVKENCRRFGVDVMPAFTTINSIFEVNITVTPKGKMKPCKVVEAKVKPQKHEYEWVIGSGHVVLWKEKYPDENPGESFTVTVDQPHFNGPYAWKSEVRHDIDGKENYIPANGRFLVNECDDDVYFNSSSLRGNSLSVE